MAGQSHTAADHLALLLWRSRRALTMSILKLPYNQQIAGLDRFISFLSISP